MSLKERQTDRQADRQTDRQTKRQTNKETERQRGSLDVKARHYKSISVVFLFSELEFRRKYFEEKSYKFISFQLRNIFFLISTTFLNS